MHKTARDLIRSYTNLACDMWTPYGVRDAKVEEVYEAVKAEVLRDLQASSLVPAFGQQDVLTTKDGKRYMVLGVRATNYRLKDLDSQVELSQSIRRIEAEVVRRVPAYVTYDFTEDGFEWP